MKKIHNLRVKFRHPVEAFSEGFFLIKIFCFWVESTDAPITHHDTDEKVIIITYSIAVIALTKTQSEDITLLNCSDVRSLSNFYLPLLSRFQDYEKL